LAAVDEPARGFLVCPAGVSHPCEMPDRLAPDPRSVSAWWHLVSPQRVPGQTRPARRCPGAARAAWPLILLPWPPPGPSWTGRSGIAGSRTSCLAERAEPRGPATFLRGILPGFRRACSQPGGAFRQDQRHAIQGFGDLAFGAGDGDSNIGEALSQPCSVNSQAVLVLHCTLSGHGASRWGGFRRSPAVLAEQPGCRSGRHGLLLRYPGARRLCRCPVTIPGPGPGP